MSPAVNPVFRPLRIVDRPTSLRVLLANQKRVRLDEAVAILVPLCIDLKARHERGELVKVHASAVMLSPDGKIAYAPQNPPSEARDNASLAPELHQGGHATPHTSVFAIGALLYEMVTGKPVGPGMSRPRDVDPSLPENLERLLAKALVSDPKHRPDDLGALATAMHQIAPQKSVPPPDADISRLDHAGDFEVDVSLSLMPPASSAEIIVPRSPSVPDLAPVSFPGGAPQSTGKPRRDATSELAELKGRLESDPRPRYVVTKERMDHGPFSAVEVLQQIARHTFTQENNLRDDLTGVSKTIGEWEEFGVFADHAKLQRDATDEKHAVSRAEVSERKSGRLKFLVGGGVIAAVATVLVIVVVRVKASRAEQADMGDDPSALDLSQGGAVGSRGKRPPRGGGPGGGPGGHATGPGGGAGTSYEQALNGNNDTIDFNNQPGGSADLTKAQLEGPIRAAAGMVNTCGAPDGMKITIQTAVKMGHVVGVSVSTSPSNPGVSGCISGQVRGLSWPQSPRMDSFTTTLSTGH